MKIYLNITTVSDAAEISFLSACDDAIGKASVPKKIVLKHQGYPTQ